MTRHPPRSPLFPYTPLFRSRKLSRKKPRLRRRPPFCAPKKKRDRKSTRLNSSHSQISYAVFCLKKNKTKKGTTASVLPGFTTQLPKPARPTRTDNVDTGEGVGGGAGGSGGNGGNGLFCGLYNHGKADFFYPAPSSHY